MVVGCCQYGYMCFQFAYGRKYYSMSVLANEVLEYLQKTGNRSTKNWLRTKFGVSSHTMTIALEELGDKLHNTVDCGGRVYFAPKSIEKAKAALQAPTYIMKPYI